MRPETSILPRVLPLLLGLCAVAETAPAQWIWSGSDIYFNKGNVGIGAQAAADAKLRVNALSGLDGVSATSYSDGSTVHALYGIAHGAAGVGVRGLYLEESGRGYGVRGEAASPRGAGVRGDDRSMVNGVRRGFAGHEPFAPNREFRPTVRGEPFGMQYPEELRAILVENGILNPDFTPNEATAAELGWQLTDPAPDPDERR